MLRSVIRVPFTISDLYGGFASAPGLLILEGEDLILEFQIRDEIFGVVKGDAKVERIQLTAVESVEYKQNWFRSLLIIRVFSLLDLNGIPGASKGELKLKISRKDRQRAKELESRVKYILSEIRLRDLDDWDQA